MPLALSDLAVRRPTLAEVFLTLTGQPTPPPTTPTSTRTTPTRNWRGGAAHDHPGPRPRHGHGDLRHRGHDRTLPVPLPAQAQPARHRPGQPVLFVLLWTYVFSGAIQTPGGIDYVDYLMPGLFILAIAFGSANTGVGLADDLTHGLIDRFRALPMARPALLVGRTLADTLRNAFVVLLMVAVGYAVGFRFHAGPGPALAALAIPLAVGYLLSWISALIGLTVGDPETAGTASLLPVILWPSPAPPSCPWPPCPAGSRPGPTATPSPMRSTPPAPWPSAAPPPRRCSGPSPGSWASWPSSSPWPSTATATSPNSTNSRPGRRPQTSPTARHAYSIPGRGHPQPDLVAVPAG
jgi:hypothetical protein